MTQFKPQPDHHQVILREVIHTIATTQEPKDSLSPILDATKRIAGARGAGLLIFDDPRLLVVVDIDESELPDHDVLNALAVSLPEGIYLSPSFPNGFDGAHWLFAQVCVYQKCVGAFLLNFDAPPQLDEDTRHALKTLIDSLTIVTSDLMTAVRQEKLGRNQSEFMRIVSHDLRSPLTSMQGFASMLESGMVGELDEKQSHFVQKILAGITQLTSLVDNIQDAGRYDPETGFYEMQRSQCDLGELARLIVRNHLLPAEKQELTLTTEIADNIPIINADVNMMERAITNLVDNAIKYTPNGRSINVSVKRTEDEKIIVTVKDNGLGISRENQKLLFERHVRIPRREHKRVKGSGLGLFIVRSVARRHGGEAWVESTEDEGTTFYISIPLNEANSIINH